MSDTDVFGDEGDEDDDESSNHEAAVEEARQEGFEKGKEEGKSSSFGCGCLVGIVLTLVAVYMGWCTPYAR